MLVQSTFIFLALISQLAKAATFKQSSPDELENVGDLIVLEASGEAMKKPALTQSNLHERESAHEARSQTELPMEKPDLNQLNSDELVAEFEGVSSATEQTIMASTEKSKVLGKRLEEKQDELVQVKEILQSVQAQLSFLVNTCQQGQQQLQEDLHKAQARASFYRDLAKEWTANAADEGRNCEEILKQSKQDSDSISTAGVVGNVTQNTGEVVLQNLKTGSYYISGEEQKVDWHTAAKLCKSYGLELVSIETNEEDKELNRVLFSEPRQDYFWTSGINLGNSSQFVWAGTGHPFDKFSSWGQNQPDNAGGNERCVHIWNVHGGRRPWNDNKCDKNLRFVCEK